MVDGRLLRLAHTEFVDTTFSGEYETFGADGCRFVRCDFSRLKVRAFQGFGVRERCEFADCRLDRLNLSNWSFQGDTLFERCTFRRTRLTHWHTNRSEFVDCVFEGRFSWIEFSGRPFEPLRFDFPRLRNRFEGNDFRAAELAHFRFIGGIDLDRQRLPEGEPYRILDEWPLRVAHVRKVIDGWPRDREWRTLDLEVQGFERPESLEQRSYLIRLDEPTNMSPDLRDRFLETLCDVPGLPPPRRPS